MTEGRGAQADRDRFLMRLVQRQRLWRLLDHYSCTFCAQPRQEERAKYATCYQCDQLSKRYGQALNDFIPITYTTSRWRLGTALRRWKDDYAASPDNFIAPWLGAVWSAYLEQQMPRLAPVGGFDLVTTVPSTNPTVIGALSAAEARGWWVPTLSTVASAAEGFPRQRDREHQERWNMQGKWLVEHKQVYDQTVLVLDDFSTTGNTLHSFAQALIRAGAHKVLAVSLVRNLGDNDATWILPLLEADHAAGRLWSPTENKRDVLM